MSNMAKETEDDFDFAVDELIASRKEAPAEVAATEDEDPVIPAAETDQPGSEAEAGTDDQAAAPAPAETQFDDIWANASLELRNAHDQELSDYKHRLTSMVGRLSTSDRELAKLRNESQKAAPVQTDPVSAEKPQAESGAPKPDLSALAEEFPEFAPLVAELQDTRQKLAALEAPVNAMGQAKADMAQAEQLTVFTDAHPDWQSYVNDPRYAAWLVEQPRAVQDAAQRSINIEDGHEAAWLLGQFKASIGVTSSSAQPQADRLLADPKRARQLAAGRDGGGGSPAVQAGIPDDFDGAVDALLAQRKAKSR